MQSTKFSIEFVKKKEKTAFISCRKRKKIGMSNCLIVVRPKVNHFHMYFVWSCVCGFWVGTEILLFCIAKRFAFHIVDRPFFTYKCLVECNTNWNLGYRDTVGHRMKLKPLMVTILLCLQCSSVRCFPFVSFQSMVLFFFSRLSQPGRLLFYCCWCSMKSEATAFDGCYIKNGEKKATTNKSLRQQNCMKQIVSKRSYEKRIDLNMKFFFVCFEEEKNRTDSIFLMILLIWKNDLAS